MRAELRPFAHSTWFTRREKVRHRSYRQILACTTGTLWHARVRNCWGGNCRDCLSPPRLCQRKYMNRHPLRYGPPAPATRFVIRRQIRQLGRVEAARRCARYTAVAAGSPVALCDAAPDRGSHTCPFLLCASVAWHQAALAWCFSLVPVPGTASPQKAPRLPQAEALPSVAALGPNPADDPDVPRSAWLPTMYVAFGVLQAVDTQTTLTALPTGGPETAAQSESDACVRSQALLGWTSKQPEAGGVEIGIVVDQTTAASVTRKN